MVLDAETAADPLRKRLVSISPPRSAAVIPFTIAKRYHALHYLAAGSYGVVVSARDALAELAGADADAARVAVKRAHNVFLSGRDARNLLRELTLLRALDHENVLKLVDVDLPQSFAGWTDVYFATPLITPGSLSSRLASHARDFPRKLVGDAEVRAVLAGLARALLYMQSASVVHRDLKTDNVLVHEDWSPVLCDLGLARAINDDEEELTAAVVTRTYRAPELFLTPTLYDGAVDMWSLGCILYELLDPAQPLVVKKKSHTSELAAVFDAVGSPTDADLAAAFPDAASHSYVRRQFASAARSGRAGPGTHTVRARLPPGVHLDAADILDRLLQFDPARRPTPAEVLAHPYLASVRDPAREVVVDAKRRAEIVALEPEAGLSKDGVRRALWDEAKFFHPEAAAKMEADGSGPPAVKQRKSSTREKVATLAKENAPRSLKSRFGF